MSLQMIASFDTADFKAWKDAFHAEHGAHADAGLKVLQIWREASNANRAWVLFEVADRTRAETMLAGEAVTGQERSGIAHETLVFLETV